MQVTINNKHLGTKPYDNRDVFEQKNYSFGTVLWGCLYTLRKFKEQVTIQWREI